jgi:hypothetical protein
MTLPVDLAVVLLDRRTPAPVHARARADLGARPYLPETADEDGWRAELRWCVAELVARRARWDARAVGEMEAKAGRRKPRPPISLPAACMPDR